MRARFLRRVGRALADSQLQQNLETNAEHMRDVYAHVFGEMEDLQEQRDRAHEIRLDVVRNLERTLDEFTDRLRQNGWQVHRAQDAREACGHVIDIARRAGADMVVKSKSLLTEEIGLNEALESVGIRPVETDLGEFIVQLRDETPSHIIAPALHLNRRQVGETLSGKLGMPPSDDIATMNAAARSTLRDFFLRAPVGISGVNFGVAENGLVGLLTNEGNGRMVTTLPPIHIAIMGAERLLRRAEELPLMLSLLSRGGAGQKLSTYQSLMRTPRREGDPDGPQVRHLIVVDNGRMDLSRGDLSEILLCIRCGACLDVCPVYREIGGHSYGSAYSGPIGSVLSPALFGVRRYGHLAKASTLCGACYDICPAKIDIPTLLLRVRHRYAALVGQPPWMKWGLRLYARLMSGAGGYRLGRRLAGLAMRLIPKRDGWITRLPAPFDAWTRYRDFPPFSPAFRDRWLLRARQKRMSTLPRQVEEGQEPARHSVPREEDLIARFEAEVSALGAEFHRCEEADLGSKIEQALADIGARSVLHWDRDAHPVLAPVVDHLREKGYDLTSPMIPEGDQGGRLETNKALSLAQAGLTGATAAFADTGTLVLSSGSGRPALASLLPPVHIAVLRAEVVHASMAEWIAKEGKHVLESESFTHFISGPSRTADIEMTLTIGVHGPGRLFIFCVGGR